MRDPVSKYHKMPQCDGLEALYVTRHHTSFPFHYHPTFNISLIYEGVFQTQLNDKLIIAPTGNILITNPQEIHANPCEKKSLASFFTFYVGVDFLTYCHDGLPVRFHQKAIYDPGLFNRLHELSLEIRQGGVAPVLEERLVQAFRMLTKKYGSGKDPEENTGTNGLFREFLAEENLFKFSLQDTAHRFGMDKFKFLRLFKSQTGLTPNNYFILKRIEKSKLLLTEGRDLLDVAIELGFYDAAHFCNHFKKFTGIPPGTFTMADQPFADMAGQHSSDLAGQLSSDLAVRPSPDR